MVASVLRANGHISLGKLPFALLLKVPLPLWERDLGRGPVLSDD